jgi:type IV secretory pathway TrbL component
MTLPLCNGGLGLSCTSPAKGSAAYLAAAASTHQVMLNGPEAFRPFDGPSGAQLRTQRRTAPDPAAHSSGPSGDSSGPSGAQLQTQWASLHG